MCPSPELWWNRGHLFVVADGMGGHAVGELASKTAVENVLHSYYKSTANTPAKALQEAMQAANTAINTRGTANREFQRMGTTCTAASISGQGLQIAHVGDSRAYRVRTGRIEQLTFDHSLQWEKMRKTGRPLAEIMREEPKNVITRSVGPEPHVKVDLEGPYPVEAGDIFILCSDGLTHYVPDYELGILAENLSPQDCTYFLTILACLRGGHDNVTAIVIKVGQDAPSSANNLSMKPMNLAKSLEQGQQENHTMLWVGTGFLMILVILGLFVSAKGYPVPGLSLSLPALFFCVALWFWKKNQVHMVEHQSTDDETVYVQPYNLSQGILGREQIRNYTNLLRKLWRKIETVEDWKFEQQSLDNLNQQLDTAIKQEAWKDALNLILQLWLVTLQTRNIRNISVNDVVLTEE